MKNTCTTLFLASLCLIFSHYSYANKRAEGALTPIEPLDWTKVMDIAPTNHDSVQVLHPVGKYKPYQHDPQATIFVNQYLDHAKSFETDADLLRFASDSVSVKNGFYLEMGVATGRSINFIAALNPKNKIYGFDSFEGLPKDWDRGDVYTKATRFALKDKNFHLQLLKNVIVYKGLFKDVLPAFKEQVLQNQPIAFLHIDSDIYESAKDTFDILGDNIVSGTIIIFDELYNYPKFMEHEWRALQEFISNKKRRVEFIGYNAVNEQVVVRVK